MRNSRGTLLVLVALGAGCALAAAAPSFAQASATAAGCNAHATVALDVRAAAQLPASGKTPLGMAQATQIANSLSAGAGDVCSAPGTAAVQAQLAKIAALYRSNPSLAHRQLVTLLGSIRSRRLASAQRLASPRQVAAGGCDATKSTVKLKSATKVGDALKAAATAQKGGDAAGSAQATATAQQAYEQWADSGSGATTAGDFVTVAKGAQMLGDEAASNAAMAKARTAATAAIDKASKVDRCTANANQLNCFIRANAVGQLVGASESVDLSAAQDFADAIGDRLQHKIPAGCEEWSFTMKLHDDETGWGITWGLGHFRVNRTTGVIEGSQLAGYGAGWPGIAGNSTSECIETTPDGTTDYGPGTLTGGPFHYSIDGTVDADGFHLQIASADGHVSVTAPDNPVCQFLADLAQQIFDYFVKGPLPIDLPVGPADTTYTNTESDSGTTFTVTVTKVSG